MQELVFLFFNSKNIDIDEVAFYDQIDDMAAVSSEEEDTNEDSDFEYY